MKINCLIEFFISMCLTEILGGSHDILSMCRDNDMADGIYSHPTDCTMFIECSGRITSEFDCPANLVFSSDLRVCDDPHNVIGGLKCAVSSTTSATTTTLNPSTTAKPTTVPSTDSTTTSTPPTTTSTPTTTTTTTTTSATSTPTTTTTTPATTTSTPPTTTTGTSTDTTQPPPTTTKSASDIDITTLCVDRSLSNGIHPDPTSCFHFIECSFGQTYRVPCPDGLAYNTRAQTCDNKFNVDCKENFNAIVG